RCCNAAAAIFSGDRGERRAIWRAQSGTAHAFAVQPPREWPQLGQVRQPSIIRIPGTPQAGEDGPGAVGGAVGGEGAGRPAGSDFRAAPSPARKPMAIMWRSITPPIAAR